MNHESVEVYNEDDAINAFLDGDSDSYDAESAINDFLDNPLPDTPPNILDTNLLDPQAESQRTGMGELNDYAAGFNDQILGLLGLPGDAANWISEKVGGDRYFHGTKEFREAGADLSIGYEEGKQPDTALYKGGEFTAMGLEFLAPFIRVGRTVVAAPKPTGLESVKIKGAVVPASATIKAGQVTVGATTAKGIAERMALPFFESPKIAAGGELTASLLSGIGAYYGGKAYGHIGELVGGIAGGGVTMIPMLAPSVWRTVQKSLFPYTETGGKMKAGQIMRDIGETSAEQTNLRIEQEVEKVLAGSNITPAKLSGDKHLQALEAEIAKSDPELYHILLIQEEATKRLALESLQGMKGAGRAEEVQATLGGRIQTMNALISRRIDQAITKAKDAVDKLRTVADRNQVNELQSKEINKALKDTRKQETVEWNKIDKEELSSTKELYSIYEAHLLERVEARSSNPNEIPEFVSQFLGKLNSDGKLQIPPKGYKNQETIKELTTFRSRLGDEIGKEKALDSPNWNKVRIMGDLSEAILKDIEASASGNAVNEALAFSRLLHERFDNGYVGMVLGNERTGTAFTPAVTLEKLGAKQKGTVAIKEILAASPESRNTIEDYLKLNLARSAVIKSDGTLNAVKAKDYLIDNAETLTIFPDLKNSIDNAIAIAEKTSSRVATLDKRGRIVAKSATAKLSTVKPRGLLKAILDSSYPEKEILRVIRKSGNREAIKNDIIDHLLEKSFTNKLDGEGRPVISGNNLKLSWDKNKKIFSKALTKEEAERIEIISNTLFRNERLDSLPNVTNWLEPKPNWMISMILTTAGARTGAWIGSKSSGASLKTASAVSNLVNKTLGKIDVGTAKRMIKESIQDKELFNALMSDTTKMKEFNRSIRIIQGWMAADVINHLESNRSQ